MHIEIKRKGLDSVVSGNGEPVASQPEELIDLSVPIVLKRRGVEAKLIVRAATDNAVAPDQDLIALVAKAHHWFGQLADGEVGSARDIAHRDGIEASEVTRTIQPAFLAPDIVEAILVGRQPIELTPRCLMRIGKLPLDWDHQCRILRFNA